MGQMRYQDKPMNAMALVAEIKHYYIPGGQTDAFCGVGSCGTHPICCIGVLPLCKLHGAEPGDEILDEHFKVHGGVTYAGYQPPLNWVGSPDTYWIAWSYDQEGDYVGDKPETHTTGKKWTTKMLVDEITAALAKLEEIENDPDIY